MVAVYSPESRSARPQLVVRSAPGRGGRDRGLGPPLRRQAGVVWLTGVPTPLTTGSPG
jgi:hypothetical protein